MMTFFGREVGEYYGGFRYEDPILRVILEIRPNNDWSLLVDGHGVARFHPAETPEEACRAAEERTKRILERLTLLTKP